MAANVYVDAYYRDHVSAQAQQSADKMQAAFKGAAMQIAGAFGIGLGIGGLLQQLKSATAAAFEAGRVDRELKSAIEGVGIAYDIVGPKIDAYAASMMELTRFTDEETKRAFAVLLNILGDVDEAYKALPLTLDLAQTKTIETSEAARLMALGLQGMTEAVIRQVPELRKQIDLLGTNATALQKQQVWIDFVTGSLQGQAIAAADLETEWQKLRNEWNEEAETLGKKLAPALTKIGSELTKELKELSLLPWLAGQSLKALAIALDPRNWLGDAHTRAMAEIDRMAENVSRAFDRIRQEATTIVLPTDVDFRPPKEPPGKLIDEMKEWYEDRIAEIQELAETSTYELKFTPIPIFGRDEPSTLTGFQAWYANLDADLKQFVRARPLLVDADLTMFINAQKPIEEISEALDMSAIDWDAYFAGISDRALVGWQFMKAGIGGLQSGIRSLLASGFEDWKSFFGGIRDAFFDLLAQMAAQAAMFGFLNLVTRGWFGGITGGLGKFMGFKAQGYETITSGPQMFVAGEAGPERVSVRPVSYNAPVPTRGQGSNVYHITYQINALDAESVIDKFVFGDWGRKMARLQSRGY